VIDGTGTLSVQQKLRCTILVQYFARLHQSSAKSARCLSAQSL
jgi:hypothetical protein